jgi:hypothetical protein
VVWTANCSVPPVVACPSRGDEHWHGAPSDRYMAHIAMQDPDENGQVVTWLDHVTGDEYLSEPGPVKQRSSKRSHEQEAEQHD